MTATATEEYRPIHGYPDYEVSNLGHVRSLDRVMRVMCPWGFEISKRIKGRQLRSFMAGAGYLMVSLGSGAKNKFYIHRLVAVAFLVPDELRPHVNHMDGIKANNQSSNLEWVTRKENSIHSTHVLKNTKGQFRPLTANAGS